MYRLVELLLIVLPQIGQTLSQWIVQVENPDLLLDQENSIQWEGFYAYVTDTLTTDMYDQNGVLGIERDEQVEYTKCPWHIARIGERVWDRKIQDSACRRDPDYKGDGVVVYIMDQEVDWQHPLLHGRTGQSFIGRTSPQPHGTHVAGLIGSMFGYADEAEMISLPVLDSTGRGTYSAVLKAFEYISRQGTNRTIINLSLGGPYSAIVNSGIRSLVQKYDYIIVVAAGNSNDDACRYSPSSASEAITVGASDPDDKYAGFSNRGKCVDIVAPGDTIISTLPNDQTGYMSGTSMASPLVAGLLASYWSRYKNLGGRSVWSEMVRQSSRGFLRGVPQDTVNRMIYYPFKPKKFQACSLDEEEYELDTEYQDFNWVIQ